MLSKWLLQMGVAPPFEFLVNEPRLRYPSRGSFSSRLVKSVPDTDAFYRVVDPEIASAPFELFVASPELNFIQMAKTFSFVQTVGYGFELCGTYTPEECGKDNPVQLLRLSSSERLQAFCRRASGMHGVARARYAADSVLDNSHSIKEMELAIMLSLGRRCRGFDVMKPVMNFSVTPKDKRDFFVSQDDFAIDLCWHHYKVGIEVDSSKFHSGELKLVKDARRRNSLQYLGYTIIQATKGDLGNALGIAGLGIQLYKAMGVKPYKGQFDVDEGRLSLCDEVFSLSNYP